MKKLTKLISIVLAIIMCLTLCPQAVFALKQNLPYVLEIAGGTAETPVVLNVTPANFSVTVPTGLPITMTADGQIETADSAKIINNSAGSVKVANVAVEGQNDWAIVDFGTDPTTFKVDEKKVGLQINTMAEITADDGTFAFDATKWGVMTATDGQDGGDDECEFIYDAILAPQSAAITDVVIANVVFTIDWDKIESNEVDGPELNQYGFYYNAPYVDSDEYGTYAFVFYEDNTLVYFEDANTAFGYDSEEFFPIYERSFEFDESTMILVDDQGCEYKFSEDGKSLESEGYTYTATGTEHVAYYEKAYLSPDETTSIVFGLDNSVVVFDAETNEILHKSTVKWLGKEHVAIDSNGNEYFISVDGDSLYDGETIWTKSDDKKIKAPIITVDQELGDSAENAAYGVNPSDDLVEYTADYFLFSGSVYSTAGIQSVTVNGVEATLDDGSWEVCILHSWSTAMEVVIIATDVEGNTAFVNGWVVDRPAN